jgi:hypothetical protein
MVKKGSRTLFFDENAPLKTKKASFIVTPF